MISIPIRVHPDLTETLLLYNNRHRDLTALIVAEGADVTASWLSQFSRGKIDDPSFSKVMRLREFLKADIEKRERQNQAK